MSAPVLWILTPVISGGILLVLRRYRRAVWIAGSAIAFLLAVAAAVLEIGVSIDIGPIAFQLEESFQILGRQFVLTGQDGEILSLLFLLAAVWFLLTPLVDPGPLFIPVGMITIGVVIAALTVDPFLFAAIFIQMIVLISMPLLVAPGKKAGRGALRFLTYETLGVPFILFSDWMLAGSEGSPGDFELVLRAAVLLGVGFAFFLAIFPFHSWLPMLFEESHPYIVAFVATFLFLVVTLFGLDLFERFVWLRNSQALFSVLRLGGIAMVLIGGVWAAFSEHLGRALGFAIMAVTGLILLTLSVGLVEGLGAFFSLARSSMLAILVWSATLFLISWGRRGMRLDDLQGAGRRSPVVAAGLILACLTIAGYPLLAGYGLLVDLIRQLAFGGTLAAMAVVAGLAGIAIHGVRVLWAVSSVADLDPETGGEAQEWASLPLAHWILLLIGIGLMVLIGVL
ncbi:MAG: hypothetical protein R3335_04895 [Anaerolineales bacterium]|nr:hypothetical protein [Anaerolineales bacterium]